LKFPNTIEEWNRLSIKVDEKGLSVGPFQVMQKWEEPLMRAMADIVAQRGDVLEVGFGLGIASKFIQDKGITSHTILEPHPQLFERLVEWAEGRNNVRPINESWEKWTKNAPDNSFDAILFDTFPTRRSELHKNHVPFFRVARRLLKRGGLFTYYSDEATHVCASHQEALLKEFSEFSVRLMDVQPSAACDYWHAQTIIVIVATK
jgi:guanidinoacetate N-methyltransferase